MVVIHNIFFFFFLIYLFSDSLQTPIVFGLVRTFSVFIPIMAHFNPFTVAQPQITPPPPSALWTCMSEVFFLDRQRQNGTKSKCVDQWKVYQLISDHFKLLRITGWWEIEQLQNVSGLSPIISPLSNITGSCLWNLCLKAAPSPLNAYNRRQLDFFPRFLACSAALVAISKTSLTPSLVFAEHSW